MGKEQIFFSVCNLQLDLFSSFKMKLKFQDETEVAPKSTECLINIIRTNFGVATQGPTSSAHAALDTVRFDGTGCVQPTRLARSYYRDGAAIAQLPARGGGRE